MQRPSPLRWQQVVAAAVVEFITGGLLREPRRVGEPLRRGLEGRWATRRGSYGVLHTIDEQAGWSPSSPPSIAADVYRRR